MLRRTRRIVETAFFILFVFLLVRTQYSGRNEIPYPVKGFLDFDPLITLLSFLAAHSVPGIMLLSLVTIAAAVAFGRSFCSWVCPVGTLNQLAAKMASRRRRKESQWTIGTGAKRFKYYLLIGFVFAALMGIQWVGVADPISLGVRSLGLSIFPAFELAARGIFDFLYTRAGPVKVVSEPVFNGLKQTVLSFSQPHFYQSVFIALLFLSILAVSVYKKRFWCRSICPLGALLGLVSRASILRLRQDAEKCNGCNLCAEVCPGSAQPHLPRKWLCSECYVCGNCTSICPEDALEFSFRAARRGQDQVDLKRRAVLITLGSTALAAPLFGTGIGASRADPLLIRPPGARPEREFLDRCVKCGECMKVCLTNGLQPTLLEAGLEGIWSPKLVPRIGYCEYECTLCGQVCPTGAIEKLEVERKKKVKIGLAFIDTARCLPFAFGVDCIVCEEHCPTPKKAIWFERKVIETAPGERRQVKLPRVDPELCIGCGICEFKCPVADRPAIYITSVGESRSEANQLLLGGA